MLLKVYRFDRYPHQLHKITRYSAPYTTKSGERRMRNQFPIEVAFAVSIHKSQGMTLDNVLISSEGIFAEAQFYVAASRVRSLNGLHLIDLKTSVIKVDLKALEEYDRLRKSCMDDFLGKEQECGAADVAMDDDMIGKDQSFGSFLENSDTGMDVDTFHDSVIQHNLCPRLLKNIDNDCFLNTLLNIMTTCETFKQQMIRDRSDSAIHEQMAKLFNRETSQARDFRFWFLDENLREGQQDINNALDDIIENIPVDSLTSLSCPICTNLMISPVTTSCQHTMCHQCLSGHAAYQLAVGVILSLL
ncbi:hypothetical protein B9Z55_000570 [Caenorhabditis nigoni]|uniref:Zinc finger RING-type eukaryotic domain-containing protein n=1 Tax=Caenorhabditis nigoni TaxID=1611254 RepID=A0A2G5VU81_9PELO|nr:hypothetical protein B9Z55_000570 [Caenorhabditis nigoni]